MKQSLEEIKELIKEFFQKGSFEVDLEVKKEDKILMVNVKTNQPQLLIGENGQTLLAIQYLLKLIIKRKFPFLFTIGNDAGEDKIDYFSLDVNQYKQKKYQYLEEMARSIADEVALTKKEKELPAMPAYQRRIIHLSLANRADVITKSIGEEPNRRVVVSPR